MSYAKVLTVDDQAEDLEIINHILEKHSYDMYSSHNGVEALHVLEKHNIDLILLDRMMPIMDGISFLRRIRQIDAYTHIPVIMQTAADDDYQVMEGIDAGVYWYITKPFSHDLLTTIVKSALRLCRRNKKISEVTEYYINKRKQFKSGMDKLRSCHFEFNNLEEASDIAHAVSCCFPEPKKVAHACSEILINAVEHGNLGISFEEKNQLVMEGKWRNEIEHRLSLEKNKSKKISVEIVKSDNKISMIVEDEGNGFDWERYLTLDTCRAHLANGRGIYLASLEFDEIKYLNNGNKAVCTKFI